MIGTVSDADVWYKQTIILNITLDGHLVLQTDPQRPSFYSSLKYRTRSNNMIRIDS